MCQDAVGHVFQFSMNWSHSGLLLFCSLLQTPFVSLGFYCVQFMSQPNFDASSEPHQDPNFPKASSAKKTESLNRSKSSGAKEPLQSGEAENLTHPGSRESRKPFLGIHFKCCSTYGRIYRSAERPVYEGRCPKCRGLLTVPIGPGGVDSRFLTAR